MQYKTAQRTPAIAGLTPEKLRIPRPATQPSKATNDDARNRDNPRLHRQKTKFDEDTIKQPIVPRPFAFVPQFMPRLKQRGCYLCPRPGSNSYICAPRLCPKFKMPWFVPPAKTKGLLFMPQAKQNSNSCAPVLCPSGPQSWPGALGPAGTGWRGSERRGFDATTGSEASPPVLHRPWVEIGPEV
jgi:hypothetical protein